MAGVQWSGGKCHGATEAKAVLRHNDRILRITTKTHSNNEIDTRLTYRNVSYRGLYYPQKAERYDRQCASAVCKRRSSGKNATVTMQDLCIYCPEGMMDEATGKYDYGQVLDWFFMVGTVLEAEFGDDLIDLEFHFDEVHQYVEPSTNRVRWSRPHAHAEIVPVIHETVTGEDGQPQVVRVLNAKKFSSRSRIVALNNKIHQMTVEDFELPYMNGSKKKGKHTVEELKRKSAEALMRMQEDIEAREKAVQRREQEQQELIAIGRRIKASLMLGSSLGSSDDLSVEDSRRLPDIQN